MARLDPSPLNLCWCSHFQLQMLAQGTVSGMALPLFTSGAAGVCEMGSWLVPGACILPTPVDVMIPLGKWERTSEKLVVNDSAKGAIRWVVTCTTG